MSKNEPKIYRQGKGLKIALKILLWTVIILAFFAIAAFFGFRRYIAYTPKGELYLDIPWLYGYMDEPDMTPPENITEEYDNQPVYYPAILENSEDYRHVETVPELKVPPAASAETGTNAQDTDNNTQQQG